MSDTYRGANQTQRRRLRAVQQAFGGNALDRTGSVPANTPRSEPRQMPQQSNLPPIEPRAAGRNAPRAEVQMNSAGVPYVMAGNRALVKKDIDELLTGGGDLGSLRELFVASGGAEDADEREVRQFGVSLMREMDMRQNMQNQRGEGQPQSMMGMAQEAAANAPPQSIVGQASEESMRQGGAEGELRAVGQRMDAATEQTMSEQVGSGVMYDPEQGTYVDRLGNPVYFDQRRRTYVTQGQR